MQTRTPRSHWPWVSRVKKKSWVLWWPKSLSGDLIRDQRSTQAGLYTNILIYLILHLQVTREMYRPITTHDRPHREDKKSAQTWRKDMWQRGHVTEKPGSWSQGRTSAESCPFLVSMIRSASLPLRVARAPARTTTTGFMSYLAHPFHKSLTLTLNDITWSTDHSYYQNYKFINL